MLGEFHFNKWTEQLNCNYLLTCFPQETNHLEDLTNGPEAEDLYRVYWEVEEGVSWVSVWAALGSAWAWWGCQPGKAVRTEKEWLQFASDTGSWWWRILVDSWSRKGKGCWEELAIGWLEMADPLTGRTWLPSGKKDLLVGLEQAFLLKDNKKMWHRCETKPLIGQLRRFSWIFRGIMISFTSSQAVRAVFRVLWLSTAGHCSLEPLLSNNWGQLFVLQSTEERRYKTTRDTVFYGSKGTLFL